MHLTFFSEDADKITVILEAYKISAKNQYIQNSKRLSCTVPIFGQWWDLGLGA